MKSAPESLPGNHPNADFRAGEDSQGRTIDYLRISITDRCNERCLYCMPGGYKGWGKPSEHMSRGQILAVVKQAVALGFRKFRVTGGEPLLREDVVEICAGIREIAPAASLGLSTNGLLLPKFAKPLREAGVDTVNVSLDAINPGVYKLVTGGDIERVFAGIASARHAGFSSVKLNCVLLKGINESEYRDLLSFGAHAGLPVRFIELMPLSENNDRFASRFLPVAAVKEVLEREGGLLPLLEWKGGHGPASYFRHTQTGAIVGFIGAMTDPDFCKSCNKLRMTADGRIRPCLGRQGELVLGDAPHGSDFPLSVLKEAIATKPADHGFLEDYVPGRPMTAIGG